MEISLGFLRPLRKVQYKIKSCFPKKKKVGVPHLGSLKPSLGAVIVA